MCSDKSFSLILFFLCFTGHLVSVTAFGQKKKNDFLNKVNQQKSTGRSNYKICNVVTINVIL